MHNVFEEHWERRPLVAIFRTATACDLTPAAEALLAGGITLIEVTLTVPNACRVIRGFRESLGDRACVGVGTVLEPEQAEEAIRAGAQFVVTPTLQPDTVQACRSRAVPIMCGAFTPTEALAAHRAGADFVKLFPAGNLGPSYVKNLLAPMPFLRVVPTGGVTVASLGEWAAAGCAGFAFGSNLLDGKILKSGDWSTLTQRAAELVQTYNKTHEDKGGGH